MLGYCPGCNGYFDLEEAQVGNKTVHVCSSCKRMLGKLELLGLNDEGPLEIHIGNFKILTEMRNGKRVAICPNCGDVIEGPFQPFFAAETGYPYCEENCRKEHVNANVPEGGY